MHSALADAILFVHAAFVAFVVLGLVAIWTGGALGWRWVGNRTFRVAHLAGIVFVAGQALAGEICPLTIWESRLREAASEPGYGGQGFIAHWVSSLLFYDAPQWVFTGAYVAFALLVLGSLWLVPVRWRRGTRAAAGGMARSDRPLY